MCRRDCVDNLARIMQELAFTSGHERYLKTCIRHAALSECCGGGPYYKMCEQVIVKNFNKVSKLPCCCCYRKLSHETLRCSHMTCMPALLIELFVCLLKGLEDPGGLRWTTPNLLARPYFEFSVHCSLYILPFMMLEYNAL